MPSISYRLPGVYTQETAGTRLAVVQTNRPIVAFVGPSIGYRSATERIILSGTDPVALANSGVIADSYTVVGASTGVTYTNNTDYVAVQQANGSTTLARKLTTLSTAKTTGASTTVTFYAAQPSFYILTDESGEPDTLNHIIRGSLTCTSGGTTYVEDIGGAANPDFVIDYHTGQFNVTAGTRIENATELTFTFDTTTAEPVELIGEAAYIVSHNYIEKNGLTVGGSNISMQIVACMTDGDSPTYDYGQTPGAANGYEEGIDFIIDYQTGRIARTASSRIPNFDQDTANFMYVAYSYCAIQDDSTAIVTYNYSSDDYNTARWISSYNEARTWYGEPWNLTTAALQSPLSMAVYLAAQNGLGGCYCVPVAGVSMGGSAITYPYTSWADAFDALTVVENVDIVVPLSGDSSVWQLALAHINAMKSNEDERVALIGADGTETVIPSTSMISAAQGFNNEDMWLVSPSTFRFRNPISSAVEVIPGYYVAACIAGYENSVPQYTPLTRKAISGIYSANEYQSKSVKTNQCANGLMYVDETQGTMRILHGRTTCTNSIVEQESNIVLTKHYVIKTLRQMFENGYIGSIITPTTLLSIKASAQSALINLRDGNYISNFTGLSVEQDASNPTQVNIAFSYVPMYGMNYIEISFSVDAASTISA